MGWRFRRSFGGRVHEGHQRRRVVLRCERFAELERSTNKRWSFYMSVSDEERRDAEKTGELVRKKLMEIMDL